MARQVMWQVRPRRHAASAPGVVSLAAELGLGLPCASGAHGAHKGGHRYAHPVLRAAQRAVAPAACGGKAAARRAVHLVVVWGVQCAVST